MPSKFNHCHDANVLFVFTCFIFKLLVPCLDFGDRMTYWRDLEI